MPSDPQIWGDGGNSHLYLHSLAVRRATAGTGVASAMLDWAYEYAASQGAEELRLDCWAGNERLVHYYATAGFEPRGEANIPGEADQLGANRAYWVAKFAKRVGR
jgi:ribosomal protein S18 acetylase RimI-like enzyme